MGREKHPCLAVMLFGLLPQSLGTESVSSHENMSNKRGRCKGEG